MPEQEKGAGFELDDAEDKTAEQLPEWGDVARDYANQFLEDRMAAADLSQKISGLEADRTALRHEIVKRLMGEPSNLSKTVATDQARLAPEYVDLSTKIVHVTNQWETRFASAEYQRMLVQIMTVETAGHYVTQNAVAELGRLKDTVDKRIRQLR